MTIVLAVRIGAGSRAAAAAASELARRLNAELQLLYIARELEAVPELAVAAGQSEDAVRERMIREIRDRLHEELGPDYPEHSELLIREGEVPVTIARTAEEIGAKLIIVGMKGRSALAKLVLGDTTGAILERAPCPVVVIPPAVTTNSDSS